MTPDFEFLHMLARAAASETLPRFRTRLSVTSKAEAGFDPVTEADREAERAIRALILKHFPDHGVLGEEHGTTASGSPFVWVIDPIDGTRAFISGLPVWGTLVGLYRDGRAVLGMMDQPFTGERFFGAPDAAFCRREGKDEPLRTRDCGGLSRATLFTTSPFLHRGSGAGRYQALEQAVNLARYGCDCYAFAMLAAGHVDLVVESDLKPYDIAALIPIIEGAGGIVTTWQGERPEKGGDIVAAATPALHAAALEILAP